MSGTVTRDDTTLIIADWFRRAERAKEALE
jgi:hypothetical protein